MSNFERGDFVAYTKNEFDFTKNGIYQVLGKEEVDGNEVLAVMECVENSSGKIQHSLADNFIELKREPKFKVGDRVVITDKCLIGGNSFTGGISLKSVKTYNGTCGTVVDFSTGYDFYYYDLVDDYQKPIPFLWIEHLLALNPSDVPNFGSDNVNHPKHYALSDKFETLDVIEAVTKNLVGIQATNTGNIIKYITRFPDKNGLEDLQKAEFYIKALIADVEKNGIKKVN